MAEITIPLAEARLERLRARAEAAGISPEEFLRRRVDRLLDEPDTPFLEAADYVLQKNAELYRRLA